jgi:hypothetical protein
MKKAAMSRSAVLIWTAVIVAGIGALVFFAPILAALLFLVLITASAIAIGRREGGWKGFLAFAKNLIFGW